MAIRMATVENTGDVPYEEEFNGKRIFIEARSKIRMPYSEATQFKSRPIPIVKDGQGNSLTKKPLQVYPDSMDECEMEPDLLVCQFDGRKFKTQDLLNEHIRKNYRHLLVDDKSREALDNQKPAEFMYKGTAFDTEEEMLAAISSGSSPRGKGKK